MPWVWQVTDPSCESDYALTFRTFASWCEILLLASLREIPPLALLPWKIDDFVDEVGGKNGTADYADYTDFLGLVVSVLTGRNR